VTQAARAARPRVPEPMAMDDPDAVLAFDVAHPILQAPIYRLNALALSRLLPENGTLLDLGSGSGRLLADLARARRDVRIEGRDLAPNMVAAGCRELAAAGLEDRVRLTHGDMTRIEDLPDRVDAVSCVWALHHLPTREHAVRALHEIARVRDERGAAVWIFDFARLPEAATFRAVMDAVPGVPARLHDDGLASEAAAFTEAELATMLRESGLGGLAGGAERRIGHLQAWSSAPPPAAHEAHERLWSAPPLRPEAAAALAAQLASGLRAVPSYS
jgi:tRNA (cmo5U34)-methyltransferase